MKKIILLALGLGFLNTSFAQGELWGVSQDGGTNGIGCIFKADVDGSNPTLVHSFESNAPGKRPEELIMVEYNGLLYGVNSDGGRSDEGVLFSLDPLTKAYTVLYEFVDSLSGRSPTYTLAITTDGKIYGTTDFGGPLQFAGTLFEYDLDTDAFTVLVDFDSTTVSGSEKQVMLAADGNLYGTAGNSGAFGDGLIFKYDLTANQYSVIYDFDNDNGQGGYTPNDVMIETSPGLLYGTTEYGGGNADGVLFSFNYTTNTYTKLFDFDDNLSGEFPQGKLLYGSNQKIYGSTREGGTFNDGVIFEYDPATTTYTLLHSFDEGTDGGDVFGLVEVGNGVFYGLCKDGGAEGDGTLFEYNLNTGTFTKKFDFDRDTGGEDPEGSLVLASNGLLYGATNSGGYSRLGTIFEYNPGATEITIVADLQSPKDVFEPNQPLMVASNGIIYGLSEEGGANDGGVLYAFDPATGTYSVLYAFAELTGDEPHGQLVEYNNKLYGTCYRGGTFDDGVIFSWDLQTSTYTIEYIFDTSISYHPDNNLTLTSDGKLLGATSNGGDNGVGTMYEFDPATTTFTEYSSFDFTGTGFATEFRFLETAPGIFYGLTSNGGSSFDGTLYKFDRSANTITVVHHFAGNPGDGSGGRGQLVLAPNGLIYGATGSGGSNNLGAFFSYEEATDTYSMLASFTGGTTPGFPDGPLYVGNDNKIYGTSLRGGEDNSGNIYTYDIATGLLEVVAEGILLFDESESGLTYIPDIYLPEAICQDATIDISGTLEGFYTPNDVDGGSRDNSSALFLGLATDSIIVTTTLSSNTDDYFANGDLYYYEQGTLILDAAATVTFTDVNLASGSASILLAIYNSVPKPNSGLLDNREELLGYVIFGGSNIPVGSNIFSFNANQTYYYQVASSFPGDVGDLNMSLDAPIITDLAKIPIDCESGIQTATLYAYDRAGNLSSCTADVSISEDEDPMVTASLDEVPDSGVPCGIYDFTVNSSATDNCGDPTILNVIEIPTLVNPTVLYKVRSSNALKIRLDQNAVKVFGPDPQGFWDQVLADGGIAVAQGQVITFREGNVASTPIVYNFNGANELTLVKSDNMTLVAKATDGSGNTASATDAAVIPCTNLPEGYPIEELELLAENAMLVDGLEVYPNPSNDQTYVQFELTRAQVVTCQVLDINGRIVETLFDGGLEAGIQQLTWRAAQVPAGIYLVQLQTEGDLQMQKIQISH